MVQKITLQNNNFMRNLEMEWIFYYFNNMEFEI